MWRTSLDGSVSILVHDFGLTVTRNIAALVLGVEETLELSLPLLVVIAAVQYLRAKRPVLGSLPRSAWRRHGGGLDARGLLVHDAGDVS